MKKIYRFTIVPMIVLAQLFLSSIDSNAQRVPTLGELGAFQEGVSHSVSSTRLSDNKVLVAYKDGTNSTTTSNLYVVVGTVTGSTISYGTPVPVSNYVLTSTEIIALSPTKAVVLYEFNADPDLLKYNVLDINGNDITVNSSGLVGDGTERAWTSSMKSIALNNNQLVVCYEANLETDILRIIAGTVNGSTISWDSQVDFESNISETAIARLTNSKFAIVYEHNDGVIDGEGKIVAGTVSGNTITMGTAQSFEASSTVGRMAISALSSSEVVVAYEDDGATIPNADPGKIFYATVSGTTFSFPGSKSSFHTDGSISKLDMAAISGTEVMVAVNMVYSIVGTTIKRGDYYVGLKSGSDISIATTGTTYRNGETDDPNVVSLTSDLVVLNYTDDDGVSCTVDRGEARILTFTPTTNPEINVQGNSTSIELGDVTPSSVDHTDFGTGGSLSRTFTIQNLGAGTLTLGSNAVTITGTNAADFSVNTQPPTTIAGNSSATFVINFASSVASTRTAEIHINNDDIHEPDYFFSVQAVGGVSSTAPTVTTQAVTSITATTATGNGNITDLGTPNPTAHGVCWSTSENPTTGDNFKDVEAASATGEFTASITGLSARTTYYVRAFATNDAGTVYGNQVSFATPPTLDDRTFDNVHKGLYYPYMSLLFEDYKDEAGDGNSLQNIRILTLPANGTLFLDITDGANGIIDDGEAIIVDQEIHRNYLLGGALRYLNTDGVNSSFTYIASDGTNDSNTATVTLNIIPTPTVTFTSETQSSSEATETITITAQLSETLNQHQVTLPFSVDNSSTATGGGTDYSITESPITFGFAETSKTILITINNDALDEGDETIVVNMGTPTNADQGATTQHTATITDDDDAPTIAFNTTSSEGLESVNSANLQINLSAQSGLPVSVNYTVTGTATTTEDYTLTDGTLNFAAGETSKNITITSIVNDLLDENNETVVVTLSNPSNATLDSNTEHIYTILDDDEAPTVAFTTTSSNGPESNASADLQVELSAASALPISVNYTVTGTATTDEDYSLADGVLNFAAGETSKNITITSIVNDQLDENNETVVVTLSNPSNATLVSNTEHIYTILDDDDAPTVAFTTTSSDGPESTASADLQVELSAASALPISVNYTVTGTATTDEDYSLTDGVLNFAAGETSKNITITSIVNDQLDENNETVVVTLSNPSNATLDSNTEHIYTILDDDDAPTVAFTTTSSNGPESTASADLQVELSAASALPISVNYTVTGTATTDEDYSLADGVLNFAAGETSKNITITSIVNDQLDENNETVVVTLSNPSNATLVSNTEHIYTILDDDDAPTVAFTTTSSDGPESNASADLQVELSAASALPISVNYTVTGTATTDEDYSLTDGVLNFAAGETSKNITITSIVNDQLDENNETVVVTLSNPSNATLDSNTEHIYTILDDDDAPTVAFTTTSSNGPESTASADLQVELSAASTLPISVNYTVTGTATTDEDYSLADGVLNFAAGETSKNITITSIVNDQLDENNETVVVTLSNPSNATLDSNTEHIYTILDDDEAPTVAFTTTSSNGPESTASANLQVELSAASALPISVNYTVTGTATTDEDYSLADGVLNFAAGETSKNITITSIVNDQLDENNETVVVTLSNPTNATLVSNTEHIYTILDDDEMPTVNFTRTSQYSTDETGNMTVAAKLSKQSGREVVIPFTINGASSAIEGTDYSITASPFTIPAGSLEAEITITITEDDIDEDNESVIVNMGSSDQAIMGSIKTQVAIITDDDESPTINTNQSFDIDENSTGLVGTVKASDTDAGTVFQDWTITSCTLNNAFIINSGTGEITVNNPASLDWEVVKSCELSITVSDGTNTSAEETVTININDVIEVGFNDLDHSVFRVYPNPTKNILNVDLAELNTSDLILEVLDDNGMILHHQEINAEVKTITLDLISYPRGVYLIRISNSDFVKTQKVIVN